MFRVLDGNVMKTTWNYKKTERVANSQHAHFYIGLSRIMTTVASSSAVTRQWDIKLRPKAPGQPL